MNRNSIIHIICFLAFSIAVLVGSLSGIEFLKFQPDDLVGPVLLLVLGFAFLVLDDELTY